MTRTRIQPGGEARNCAVTPINLQALRVLHEKMVPGQGEAAAAVRRIACEVLEDQATTFVSERVILRMHNAQCCSCLAFAADVIATRIDEHATTNLTALMNALPVLLEITETALALRTQERAAARARFEVHKRSGRDIPDALYVALATEDIKLKACQDAYDAALAKATISPLNGGA